MHVTQEYSKHGLTVLFGMEERIYKHFASFEVENGSGPRGSQVPQDRPLLH